MPQKTESFMGRIFYCRVSIVDCNRLAVSALTHRPKQTQKHKDYGVELSCLCASVVNCFCELLGDFFFRDHDLHAGRDITEQAERNRVLANGLDGLVEVDLAAIDGEALLFELCSDV